MEQVLYDLPDGWEWKTVNDISHKVQYGFTAKSGTQGNAKFLRITDIQNGKINWDLIPSVLIAEKDIRKYLLNNNELVFARSGATAGKSILIKNASSNVIFASYLIRIVPRFKMIDPEYLAFFFLSPMYWKTISNNVAGAAQPNVNGTKLSALTVPLAPLPEQQRLVAKLDALLSRIDKAIELLRACLALLDQTYSSALEEAFNPLNAPKDSLGKMYELPEGWEWSPLKLCCDFENGDRGKNYPSRSMFIPSGIAVINAGCLNGRSIITNELNYISQEKYDLISAGKIQKGDLLFCLRGSLGKCAFITHLEKGVIASSLVIVRPHAHLTSLFLLYYFNSNLCTQFIRFYNNGAAQPNLSAKSLSNFLLPLPSVKEQSKIVQRLDVLFTKHQQSKDGMTSQITRLEQLKASILDAAFKGAL